MEEIKYYYRGLIERGHNYHWANGYSEGDGKTVCFPWMTFRECQRDAKKQNKKAVFIKN